MDSTEIFHIHIFAVAALGPGVSGGDKFFIECARVWATKGHLITLYVTEEGFQMCQRHGLKNVRFSVTWAPPQLLHIWFGLHYLVKTVTAIWLAVRLSLEPEHKHIIYSAGDSLPDVLPSCFLRLRYKAARWMAAFFFFAPTPWPSKKDMAYRGGRQPVSMRSILYFTFQQIAYPLIRSFADFCLVCNHLDRVRMEKDGLPMSKTLSIYGGIDFHGITQVPTPSNKTFDGCFVGRFHIQKGPLVLIDIWAHVVKTLPSARLAIIGEGSLRKDMLQKIQDLQLEQNIFILGYLDGDAKYRVLKSSRIFLHPPTYDTGGMAAAEAMACELPVVGFDLPGYRYCYPKGMSKVPIGAIKDFATEVARLLTDPSYYVRLSREAFTFAKDWDWQIRACSVEDVFKQMHLSSKKPFLTKDFHE